MKSNCKTLKIAIWLSIVSLLLSISFFVLECKIDCNVIEFVKDIFLGTFCSSIVAVFFYASQYSAEKTALLQKYWNEIRKILNEQEKIEFFCCNFDEDLLINFIYEMKKLNAIKSFVKNTNINQKAINKIKKIVKSKNKNIIKDFNIEDKNNFIQNELNKIYERAINDVNKIANQYMNFANYDIDEITLSLGNMEFFTGKKCYKVAEAIYNNIYDLQLKFQEIKCFLKTDRINEAIVLTEILKIQKNIFRVKNDDNYLLIYNEFNNNMNHDLEYFRSNIIYKIKPKYRDIFPILEVPKLDNKSR